MEISVYEGHAKQIVADIKEIIEAKGINLDEVTENAGIPKEKAHSIFSGQTIPSLTEFLILCEISGITFKLPSVETPNNPM